MKKINMQLSFSSLTIEVQRIGNDLLATIYGGDRPHLGCVVMAVPRLSLTGDGSRSCTSSVLNLIGHKDELICRILAEELCRKNNVVTVCTGGFHFDQLKAEQISEVQEAAKNMIKELGEQI